MSTRAIRATSVLAAVLFATSPVLAQGNDGQLVVNSGQEKSEPSGSSSPDQPSSNGSKKSVPDQASAGGGQASDKPDSAKVQDLMAKVVERVSQQNSKLLSPPDLSQYESQIEMLEGLERRTRVLTKLDEELSKVVTIQEKLNQIEKASQDREGEDLTKKDVAQIASQVASKRIERLRQQISRLRQQAESTSGAPAAASAPSAATGSSLPRVVRVAGAGGEVEAMLRLPTGGTISAKEGEEILDGVVLETVDNEAVVVHVKNEGKKELEFASAGNQPTTSRQAPRPRAQQSAPMPQRGPAARPGSPSRDAVPARGRNAQAPGGPAPQR